MCLQVFGLTGGIASGKSTVAEFWRRRRLPVIDADALAKSVVAPGTEGLAEIVSVFGARVLRPDGTLDRAQVAARVFAEIDARRKLEAIIHPRIQAALEAHSSRLRDAGAPLACYDAPLLFEGGRAEKFRPLVVVDVPPETQMKRATARDAQSAEAIRARIHAQLPSTVKVRMADYVISNNGDLWHLSVLARDVLKQICERLGVDPTHYDWSEQWIPHS